MRCRREEQGDRFDLAAPTELLVAQVSLLGCMAVVEMDQSAQAAVHVVWQAAE